MLPPRLFPVEREDQEECFKIRSIRSTIVDLPPYGPSIQSNPYPMPYPADVVYETFSVSVYKCLGFMFVCDLKGIL